MKFFKNFTGLSQEEMATFLGIQRSVWSMFVTGKRNLSLQNKLKLNELLVYLNSNENSKIYRDYLEREKIDTQKKLNERLRDLTISLNQVKNKLKTNQKIRKQLLIALNTVEYLKKEGKTNQIFVNQIQERVKNSLAVHSEANLELLKLKKKGIEKQIIELKKTMMKF